jgi:hypothetical protein
MDQNWNKETNTQSLKVWQPRRAARWKRPKTPSDGTKANGAVTHPETEVLSYPQQQSLRRPQPTQHQNHYGPDHQKSLTRRVWKLHYGNPSKILNKCANKHFRVAAAQGWLVKKTKHTIGKDQNNRAPKPIQKQKACQQPPLRRPQPTQHQDEALWPRSPE